MSGQLTDTTHILGCKVDTLSKDQVLQTLIEWMRGTTTRQIVTLNPEICLHAYQDDEYRKKLNKADLTTVDGIGLKYAAPFLQTHLPDRIIGLSIINALASLASKYKQSVYLIGAQEGVAQKAADRLQAKYPHLRIAGAQSGPTKERFSLEDETYARQIASTRAKVVLVAFGAPKQELWIQQHKHLFVPGTILVGIGGAFDYLAGTVKSPPRWVKQLGFEWLFRLFTQRGRLKRIFRAVIKFPITIIFWRLRLTFVYRKNVVAMIENKQKEILLVTPWWSTHEHWQFPQGGVDKGESSESAILREMSEELGTNKFRIQAKKEKIHRYEWPWSHRLIRGYKGQKQDLFLLEFTGENADFDIETEGEIAQYRWVNKDTVLETLAPPRRSLATYALAFYDEQKSVDNN